MPSADQPAIPSGAFGKLRSAAVRFGDTLIALSASAVLQVSMLVSGIAAARMLGPEDRGIIQLFALIPLILVQIGTLGLPLAATYFISQDPKAASNVVASLKTPVLLVSCFMLCVHAVVLAVVFAGEDNTIKTAAAVSLIATPGALAQLFGTAILQGLQNLKAYSFLRILHLLLYSIGLSGMLILGERNLIAATAVWSGSFLVAGLSTAAIVAARLTGQERTGPTPVSFSRLLAFGKRSFVGSLNPVDSFRLDQLLVAVLVGPVALGFYVAALAFTNLPRFMAQSLSGIAYPRVARSSERGAILTLKYAALAVATCGLSVLVLEGAIGWAVPFFFGQEFVPSVLLARVLLLSALFLSLRRVLTECLRGMGNPELGTIAEVVSWFVLLPAMALLIPSHGALGMAWSLAAASSVSLTFVALASWRYIQGIPATSLVSQEFAR